MIKIDNLRMTYRSSGTEHVAVNGVSLTVNDGEFYTLLGPSGSGKTTLLRVIAGLEYATAGSVLFDGVEIAVGGGGESISLVQNEHANTYRAVDPGLLLHVGELGVAADQDRRRHRSRDASTAPTVTSRAAASSAGVGRASPQAISSAVDRIGVA